MPSDNEATSSYGSSVHVELDDGLVSQSGYESMIDGPT